MLTVVHRDRRFLIGLLEHCTNYDRYTACSVQESVTGVEMLLLCPLFPPFPSLEGPLPLSSSPPSHS